VNKSTEKGQSLDGFNAHIFSWQASWHGVLTVFVCVSFRPGFSVICRSDPFFGLVGCKNCGAKSKLYASGGLPLYLRRSFASPDRLKKDQSGYAAAKRCKQ
jgi:hypothetical protein